jgi:uncharacterized protein YbjT (DUF2867 family)
MKIVVIGGSGLIGAKVVNNLRQRGHEVVAASPSTGVNTLTGEGLAEALAGARVVVDVANSPSFEDKPATEFFETSGRNLLAGEAAAGVEHHVALSVVGTDRLNDSGDAASYSLIGRQVSAALSVICYSEDDGQLSARSSPKPSRRLTLPLACQAVALAKAGASILFPAF